MLTPLINIHKVMQGHHYCSVFSKEVLLGVVVLLRFICDVENIIVNIIRSLSVSGFPYILVSPHGYQSSAVIQLTKEIICYSVD